MSPSSQTTPDTVPRALGRLRAALDDAFVRAGRELDLTPQQAELLCAAMVPASVGGLADALGCDRSNVSRLVDRASARGLLARQPGDTDGRVSMVVLTDAGHRLARNFISLLEAQLVPLTTGWSTQRCRTAVRIFNEVAESLDAKRTAPGAGPSVSDTMRP